MGWFEERGGLGGTVAVITGGAGGLGAAIATDLAANGVRLGVIDKDLDAVEALREGLRVLGAEAIVHHGDVRDDDELRGLFDAVDARWARLDTLVNVVGGTFRAPFLETTPKGWDALIRTNLTTVLSACALAAPRMRAGGRGGSIVNLSTVEAHRAAPGFAVYAAAKAGVEQFARTLAVELAPDGIRVNNVAPDYTPTPRMQAMGEGDGGMSTETGLKVAIPMGRAGVPQDVAGCVVFLASQLSAYMTGTTLHPDGGTYASAGWLNWPDSGWSNHAPGPVLEGLTP